MNRAKDAFKDGYRSKDGLIWKNGEIVELPEADIVANKYGYMYAERLVTALANVIACRLCGLPTEMLGTKLCDRCWEIEHRVQADPAIAVKVLEAMGFKVDCSEYKKPRGKVPR